MTPDDVWTGTAGEARILAWYWGWQLAPEGTSRRMAAVERVTIQGVGTVSYRGRLMTVQESEDLCAWVSRVQGVRWHYRKPRPQARQVDCDYYPTTEMHGRLYYPDPTVAEAQRQTLVAQGIHDATLLPIPSVDPPRYWWIWSRAMQCVYCADGSWRKP